MKSKTPAEQIVAEAIEILYGQLQEMPLMESSKTVRDYLRLKYGHLSYEQLGVLALNAKLRLLKDIPLFRGTTDKCNVYLKELFRELLLCGPACGFIVYHNHPSGEARPSPEDASLTRRCKEASELLGFRLVDHIIVSAKGHYSFADNGWQFLKT